MAESKSEATEDIDRPLDKGDPEKDFSEHRNPHHRNYQHPHVHIIKKEASIILKKKEFIFCLVGGLSLVAGLVFFIISMYSIRNCCACPGGGRINPILPADQQKAGAIP